MSDEGKLSRALAKAGSDDALDVPQEGDRQQDKRTAKSTGGLQRVLGQAGQVAPDVVMVHDKLGPVASQIRALRARLLAKERVTPLKILTVSSAQKGEGKSVTSANLAAALAELEEGAVAIIDGDLVGPRLHRIFNLSFDRGLNDILQDNARLDGGVYETGIAGVDLIPSHGVPERDGMESVLNQSVERFFRELERHYRYVVVDTPPVLTASQAVTFGRSSDGVILAVRLEKTPREVVRRAVGELVHSDVELLGCVLTHRRHHVPEWLWRVFGSSSHYPYGKYMKH